MDKKRNCESSAAEKFSVLSHVLSQTPTRRYAAGFNGKTPKADDPTGVDCNGTTANERKRVGIKTGRTYLYYSSKLFISSSLTMRGVF